MAEHNTKKITRRLLSLILLSCISWQSVAFDDITVVTTTNERYDYWDENHRRMARYMPTDLAKVVAQHNGDVSFTIEYTIDSQGDPQDFVFISAVPAAANIHANEVKAYYMFKRFKPSSTNKNNQAVRFKGQVRWHDPNKFTRHPGHIVVTESNYQALLKKYKK